MRSRAAALTFSSRQPRRETTRQFGLARGFIEIDGKKRVRFDADLLQEFEPPGATPTPKRALAAKPYRPPVMAAIHCRNLDHLNR